MHFRRCSAVAKDIRAAVGLVGSVACQCCLYYDIVRRAWEESGISASSLCAPACLPRYQHHQKYSRAGQGAPRFGLAQLWTARRSSYGHAVDLRQQNIITIMYCISHALAHSLHSSFSYENGLTD
jgi:hypothetical protein